MSGVISPTNLSLYSAPITAAPRTTARTRWNTSVILEEDFNMVAQHPSTMPTSNPDTNSIILMEEGKKTTKTIIENGILIRDSIYFYFIHSTDRFFQQQNSISRHDHQQQQQHTQQLDLE